MSTPPAIHGAGFSCWIDGDEVKVKSQIPDGTGTQDLVVALPKKFVLASLIRFCLENNIVLPEIGKRSFLFQGGRACVEIVQQPNEL